MASSSTIEWNCPQCRIVINGHRKFCDNCRSMLVWTCISSEKSGLYANYGRHRDRCNYCSPEREEERQQLKTEKQISSLQGLQTLYVDQRPWSEWSRNNNTCMHHTGYDIDQVQQIFNMCEQSLVEYCTNRKKHHSQSANIPFSSPINLLAITLWYLKHYHSERYLAAEFDFNQSTVNYFLSAVIDILYSCVYPRLVVLPDDMDDEDTIHGPEEYHKLIVDSTFIAIHQPEDCDERKAYYHAKSLTNYAFKIQITCDFNHRIVHVSNCYRGSKHDITVLRESGLLQHTSEEVQIIADKGYVGEQYVITPRKKPRGGELTNLDKDFNRTISRARAAIENINQRVKQYAILGHTYRGSFQDVDKITKIARVVCALCNLNLDKHPIRAQRS